MNTDGMKRNATLAAGMALGAGIMYLLDPDRGSRRRALVRDKMVRAGKKMSEAADKRIRDLNNRARGAVAERWARLREQEIGDEVLQERVCAQLGHVVSHPGSLVVNVEDGNVTVSGPVLMGEQENIRRRLEKTRGVKSFHVRVQEHSSREAVPGLQGESRWERTQKVG